MNLPYLGPTPSLNQLEPGVVSLKAPVDNDAIQVGRKIHGPIDMTRLRVAVGASYNRIVVRREDGQDLQLESHLFPWDATPSLERRLVLAEPMGRIVLCRHPEEIESWTVQDIPLTKENQEPLTVFAQTIGWHAWHKQSGETGPPYWHLLL